MIGLTAAAFPSASDLVIDAPKLLSQVNHRLYRQSRYYECSITLDTDNAEGSTVDVYALADTWMVQKAYQMAKMAFDESNAEEKKMLNGRTARWNDFRVAPGVVTSGGAGEAAALQFNKRTLGASKFTVGEFINSQVVDSSGGYHDFTWGNSDATTYSVIDEYDKSGNTDIDPTFPAIGPYSGLLPNLEPGAAEALQDDGNNPPYDGINIGVNIWVKVATLHLGAGRQRTSTGTFTAPCGLIVMKNAGQVIGDNTTELTLDVKRGDYKGVHAPSMLE